MKPLTFYFLISFIICSSVLFAQVKDSSFEKLNKLSGNWFATGGGQPGQGSGNFSFDYELNKKVMVRKSLSEYPAVGNKPAIIHEDLMIIYTEGSDNVIKAIYFDGEGHVINYKVSFTKETIQFISDARVNTPGFRLTYTILHKDQMEVNFEIASPNNPDQFNSYLKGTAIRKK